MDLGQKNTSRSLTLPAILWILVATLFDPGLANAQTLSVEETLSLVRSVHIEGIAESEASRVGPDGAARLIEMLQDSGEAATHANVLIVLGYCGQPGSFEAIQTWASVNRSGEIDRSTFRAWQALPYAFGHSARFDPRALVALEEQFEKPAPTWTFRHHRGARLHRQSVRASATALAMTGLPEAARALDRVARRTTDAEFDEHLRGVRALHRNRANGGRPR
jgi:hypothetical protein